MTRHAAHVRLLCAEHRFSWAHSYVDRLIAEHPDDPEPVRLKELIHSLQAAPQKDPSKGANVAAGVIGLLLLVAGLALVKMVVALTGNVVGDTLGLPADEDGESIAGLLIVIAAGWALYFGWWAIKTKRSGIGIAEGLRRKRARSRDTAAWLDDVNLRHHANVLAAFLSFTCILAAAPAALMATWDPEVTLRIWPPLLALGLFGWAWGSLGREQLGRAFRLSGLLVVYTVVSLAWVIAIMVFPLRVDPAWPYLFGWAVLGWLIQLPALFVRGRQLKRAGQLQRPAHWRR